MLFVAFFTEINLELIVAYLSPKFKLVPISYYFIQIIVSLQLELNTE